MSKNVSTIESLQPKKVFEYFAKISDIPRGSFDEQRISDYLVEFAKKHNLEYRQDELLNVIIKKKATKGYEELPAVILQGHMDMVCEKNSGCKHDFEKDPIELIVEGEYIKANGTTLGADNGIAVAYILAILSDTELEHPAIEAIITTQEEVGLKGAAYLEANDITGKYMINLDAEEEGIFYASCAGGARSNITIDIHKEMATGELAGYELAITGLKGGHSGSDIDKNRGNANKILGRVLYLLSKEIRIHLSTVTGGLKENAIPRESFAKLLVNSSDEELFVENVNKIKVMIRNEFAITDSNLNIEVKKSTIDSNEVFAQDTLESLVNILMCMPNGVNTMSSDIEGLVESSTNLGVVTIEEEKIVLKSNTRSSVGSLKEYILYQLEIVARTNNANFEVVTSYPEWKYNRNSKLRELFIDVYKEYSSQEPEIAAIHAGLECGLLSEKLDGVDIIALGPNMQDVHTPDEKLDIESTKRTWEFLIKTLSSMKNI